MTIGDSFSRVKQVNMPSEELCGRNDWYILDIQLDKNKAMFSALLAAKASGQKVHFQLTGCWQNYPKITHVYNCKNQYCTNE
ncbi:hypothetical protein [Shewanella woodyi]|nr:hypothetical protein [Shewanella woodyi]